ncbi:hypothetical protein EDC01DRAFT_617866 [Geopyxis carbonaria]|nr:hypothetical protein EDC01DRAFT_617866 [Geopyxis carbonaria]
MARPARYFSREDSYLIGNTPPFCFTSGLPPEEPAHVLLLGCGDPRSILYTIFSEGPTSRRELDFTCCDVDVNILARNAILFTLLADSVPQEKVWSIFYDRYLDDATESLLASHCQKLYKMSDTIDHWNSECYGCFLRISSAKTLLAMRNNWKFYRDFIRQGYSQNEEFKENFAQLKRKHPRFNRKINPGEKIALHTAGPMWIYARECERLNPDIGPWLETYWKPSLSWNFSQTIESSLVPNTTLVPIPEGPGIRSFESSTWNPLLGFHLTQRYVKTKPQKRSATTASGVLEVIPAISCAKEQFEDWCNSFKRRIRPRNKWMERRLCIRLLAGDVGAICKTLKVYNSTSETGAGLYYSQWNLSQLMLDGGDYVRNSTRAAPSKFNVIDTSNLIDHLGLLNILLYAIPLLSQSPVSTLYTQTMTSSTNLNSYEYRNSIFDEFCGNVPLMSILLGIVPSKYISNFTTNYAALAMPSIENIKCFLVSERLSWKILRFCDEAVAKSAVYTNLKFEEEPFAKFLFRLYKTMLRARSSQTRTISWKSNDASTAPLYYSPESFVQFLVFVKESSTSQWNQVMELFLSMVRLDKGLSSSYHDLITQLHQKGFYKETSSAAIFDQGHEINETERTPESTVCITLIMPHLVFPTKPGVLMPALVCEIVTSNGRSEFASIHLALTSAKKRRNGVFESINDLRAENNAIVSFWAPFSLLSPNQFDDVIIKLRVQYHLKPRILSILGLHMLKRTIFTAKIHDEEHVMISNHFPNLPTVKTPEIQLEPRRPVSRGDGFFSIQPISIHLSESGNQIMQFAVDLRIIDSSLQTDFASGAAVNISQNSPCTITISLGVVKKVIAFPYPVDQKRGKIQIDRQAFCIKLSMPPSHLTQSASGLQHCFPVNIHQNNPSLWNIHYLNMENLPRIEESDFQKNKFLHHHIYFSIAYANHLLDSPDFSLLFVKKNICQLFFQEKETPTKHTQIILKDPEDGEHTIIFITDFYLDLSAETVALDVCILPLTTKLKKTLMPSICNRPTFVISAERKPWTHLIPVLTERCRTWKHRDSCEYRVKGIPASTNLLESPLCSCAPGNASPTFLKHPEYRKLAKYVTRGVISPFFPPNYVERPKDTLFGRLRNVLGFKRQARGLATLAAPARARTLYSPSRSVCVGGLCILRVAMLRRSR